MILDPILDALACLQSLPKTLFLVGLPSCGKTKNGTDLAHKLGYTFIDTDHLIQEMEGKTVAEIFAQFGEPHFRLLEQKYLRNLPSLQNYVISTGGGLPCYHNNMQWMNQNGCTIWLNCPVEVIIDRLVAKSEERPLTKGKSKHEIQLLVKNLAAQRFEIYKQAQLIIQV